MADISGLVVSTVALASLFSTCVELFEVVELHRDFLRDYHLAATKISLLRKRFTYCGVVLHLDERSSRATEETDWFEEEDILVRSLRGIESLLCDATELGQKHTPPPVPRSPRGRRLPPPSPPPTIAATTVCAQPTGTAPAKSRWLHLWSRAAWAVHDKNKIDSLVRDLDFFMSNLEKVSEQFGLAERRDTFATAKYSKSGGTLTRTKATIRSSTSSIAMSSSSSSQTAKAADEHVGNESKITIDNADQENVESTGVIGSAGATKAGVLKITDARQRNKKKSFGVIGIMSEDTVKTRTAAEE